jgi:hypothetical protein
MGSINRRISVQAVLGINARPYSQNNHSKKGVLQVVESLPGKHKTLSSNPSTANTRP